jgi:hypothetical protein
VTYGVEEAFSEVPTFSSGSYRILIPLLHVAVSFVTGETSAG